MNSYYSISYIFMLILTSSLLQQQNLLIHIEWVYIEFTRDVQLEYSGLYMVWLLDIYSGVYIDVIVYMVCTDLYRWSIQVCK